MEVAKTQVCPVHRDREMSIARKGTAYVWPYCNVCETNALAAAINECRNPTLATHMREALWAYSDPENPHG